jgi:zinc/manganese transport system substrate-binding protein
MRALVSSLLWLLVATAVRAELKVAALHPLLADLAKQLGREHVEVVDLLGPSGNPHSFEPTPSDLRRAGDAKIYLACGMGLESYLPGLVDATAGKANLVVVGDALPTLAGGCEHGPGGREDPSHQHGVDPHWWHSPDAFRRAASVVAEAFAAADPQQAASYRANAEEYRERLTELERWARRELARVPAGQRYLATTHDAFGYFCRDFGFTAVALQGLNREQSASPEKLAKTIEIIRSRKLRAIFPEQEANPKVLEAVVADTGVRLAEPLSADGVKAGSFEAMLRGNVERIVSALAR